MKVSHRLRGYGHEFGPVVRSALSKTAATPVVAVAQLAAARFVLQDYGVSGYAAFALVSGLGALLPFVDLGLGATVMDAAAHHRASGESEAFADLIAVALRRLCTVALAGIAISVSLGVLGLWTRLLGIDPEPGYEVGCTLAGAFFALGIPLGVGYRMLTGLGMNSWAIAGQASAAAIAAAVVIVAGRFHAGVELVLPSTYIAATIPALVAFRIASRHTMIPPRRILRLMVKRLTPRKFGSVAVPMLVISVALPVAYQSDRIVIARVTHSSAQLAEYSLVFQLFAPAMGVLGAAAVTLWPSYKRLRHEGRLHRRRFYAMQGTFAVAGLSLALVLMTLGPTVVGWISSGAVAPRPAVYAAFATLIVLQAASYPMAMLLTDPWDLRMQAWLHVAMVVVNLPLSVLLTHRIGPAGPVAASACAIAVALFVPQCVRTRYVVNGGQRAQASTYVA